MRIEAYTQVQQLYKTNKPAKTSSTAKTGFADQLQLSSQTREVQTARAAIAKAPDVREDVIAPIKERIQNGTYEVSAEQLADKLYAQYQEMR